MRRTDGDDGDDYMDLRPKRIRADLEASLRRLRRDSVACCNCSTGSA